MAKPKIIGEEIRRKGKSCAYCGQVFSWKEFFTHAFHFGSDKIKCRTCGEESFIYTTDNRILRFMIISAAFLFAVIAAVPGLLYIPVIIAEYNADTETFKSTRKMLLQSTVFTVVSPLIGIVVGRYSMHILDWIGAKIIKLEEQPSMLIISENTAIQSDGKD